MNNLEKIAIMIDADNTQISKIGDVLREVSKYGRIVVKRAYGNWKKEHLKNWEVEINRLAIKAIQQFDYVHGKNTSDIALVIDAIDLLHTDNYDAFVIVSSDSDYTPLAVRLRESGVYVFGVGEKKTPEAFRNACDEFLLLENIFAVSGSTQEHAAVETGDNVSFSASSEHGGERKIDADDVQDDVEEIHGLLKSAYETYQGEDGFANIAAVGSFIKRAKPDFDCRTYGYSKLPQFLEAFPQKYEVTRYPGKGTVIIVAYKCID